MKKSLMIILCAGAGLMFMIVAVCFLWRKSIENENKDLIKQGNELVKKIETCRRDHYKLPDSLQQLGVKITKDYQIDYTVEEDSINYILAFPISSFHSQTYRSSIGRWGID
jgi:hypothetical protein